MHEQGLIRDLVRKLEAIAAEEAPRRMVGARVVIGALAHISADHFRDHFARAVAGTPLASLALEVVEETDVADPRAQEILLESVVVAEGES
ncbi:MAG: hypothetical protein KatS3mg124_1948 [Porticoccaceae bacterium]|nr:MAG: hypothetical protein KatS3mg124_1948 [Porticoccaceae bacterium]